MATDSKPVTYDPDEYLRVLRDVTVKAIKTTRTPDGRRWWSVNSVAGQMKRPQKTVDDQLNGRTQTLDVLTVIGVASVIGVPVSSLFTATEDRLSKPRSALPTTALVTHVDQHSQRSVTNGSRRPRRSGEQGH